MSRLEDFIGGAPNKHFSNAIITWEIERFPLISCTQKQISSPVITLLGPVATLWRMHIDMAKKSDITLKLEMVPNNTMINRVKVQWAYCVLDENEKESFSLERTFTFEPQTKIVTDLFSRRNTLEMLSRKPCDNLIIKCHMLINFGLKLNFPNARVAGVMGLSNDLVGLPKSFLYHDVTTKVGNEEFSLHKAILHNYGVKIVHLLEQSTSNMNVDFSFSNEKAAASIFAYLYTGDLKYILASPCIAISDYIEYLEIPNLKNVYSLQRIKIASRVELKEQIFSWTVSDFKNVTRTLVGPEFQIDSMESRFQLSLNIRESTDNEPIQSLYVEAKLLDTEKLLVVCLQFSCGKNDTEMLSSKRFYKVMGVGDRVGATVIKNDCPEMEEYFLNDTLAIKVTVHIRIGEVLGDIVESETTPASINFERSFMNLCKMLGNLKKSNAYSDFHFEFDEEHIKSHKFFVAARSPLMKELLRRHESMVSVKVYSCKKEVFEKFLSYMYTGILSESDADKLIELYNLGNQYSVYGLQNVVTSLLVKLVNDENMLNVLIFADDIEDDALKNAAINHILKDCNKLREHRDYLKFLAKKPRVHMQVQQLIAKQAS